MARAAPTTPTAPDRERGPGDTTYVLVDDGTTVAPGRSGGPTVAGWSLLTLTADGRHVSLPLAGRGAAPAAPARVAQAVALRVLHDRGVEVAGWRGAGGDRGPMFLAALAPDPVG